MKFRTHLKRDTSGFLLGAFEEQECCVYLGWIGGESGGMLVAA